MNIEYTAHLSDFEKVISCRTLRISEQNGSYEYYRAVLKILNLEILMKKIEFLNKSTTKLFPNEKKNGFGYQWNSLFMLKQIQ